ncbi:Uncharacterised protein [Klebsiella michiganensis]|nr:Uncharacterised protein [Klebsiella michiganensis]
MEMVLRALAIYLILLVVFKNRRPPGTITNDQL